MTDKTMRAELLDEANDLVNGDRNNTYGPPHQDFQHTADMMSALGFSHNGKPIEAHHVAMILAAVKLSRLSWSPGKRDSWVDLAGYAACGHEAYELTRPVPVAEVLTIRPEDPDMPNTWAEAVRKTGGVIREDGSAVWPSGAAQRPPLDQEPFVVDTDGDTWRRMPDGTYEWWEADRRCWTEDVLGKSFETLNGSDFGPVKPGRRPMCAP